MHHPVVDASSSSSLMVQTHQEFQQRHLEQEYPTPCDPINNTRHNKDTLYTMPPWHTLLWPVNWELCEASCWTPIIACHLPWADPLLTPAYRDKRQNNTVVSRLIPTAGIQWYYLQLPVWEVINIPNSLFDSITIVCVCVHAAHAILPYTLPVHMDRVVEFGIWSVPIPVSQYRVGWLLHVTVYVLVIYSHNHYHYLFLHLEIKVLAKPFRTVQGSAYHCIVCPQTHVTCLMWQTNPLYPYCTPLPLMFFEPNSLQAAKIVFQSGFFRSPCALY